MIKDVEFAFFSQLAYLNWNRLSKEDLENPFYESKNFIEFLESEEIWEKIKINDLKIIEKGGMQILSEEDKRAIGFFTRVNSKTRRIERVYDFKGWQYIYSANKTKLYKDIYGVEIDDDGFFAVAFKKENNIVIAYRGTEPLSLKDLLTDLEIGFFKKNSSQLVSSYLFFEYIKNGFKDCEINFTGHSLGGCLAQYAYICSGKRYRTVTWNALGVGRSKDEIKERFLLEDDIARYIKIDSKAISENIKSSYVNSKNEVVDDILNRSEKEIIMDITSKITGKTINSLESGMRTLFQKNVFGLNIKFGTFDVSGDRRTPEISKDIVVNRDGIKDMSYISALQIYLLLKSVKLCQIFKNINSEKIVNYYNSLDWTSLLQTREGEIVDVITNSKELEEATNDRLIRVLSETFTNFGFKYHGVNDFLLYLDEDGNILGGKFNKIFGENLLKMVIENYYGVKEIKRDDLLKDIESLKDIKEVMKKYGIKYVIPANNTLIDIDRHIDKLSIGYIGVLVNIDLGGIKIDRELKIV